VKGSGRGELFLNDSREWTSRNPLARQHDSAPIPGQETLGLNVLPSICADR